MKEWCKRMSITQKTINILPVEIDVEPLLLVEAIIGVEAKRNFQTHIHISGSDTRDDQCIYLPLEVFSDALVGEEF